MPDLAPIEFIEVSSRDGLQNEPELVSTQDKLSMINRIVGAGFKRMEVASFVNPKKVPQMADGEAVMAGLPDAPDVTFIALALNRRGYDRAAAAGAKEVNYSIAASDGFSIRNAGVPAGEAVSAFGEVAKAAHADGVSITATISTCFGCPFDGEVPTSRVKDIAKAAYEAGAEEVAIADTIGVGVPSQVRDIIEACRPVVGDAPLRVHFHNTRNTALANSLAAYESGVTRIDGSLAGIGGCPFAPGAAGNVPTEDLLYMFERMGIRTGVNLDRAISAAQFISHVLDKQTPGMVSRAGSFPPSAPA